MLQDARLRCCLARRDLARSRLFTPAAPERAALLLIADHQYTEAAALDAQIGSHPLAADIHLVAAENASTQGRAADASHHAQAVLVFAEQTGAILYKRQAEQFLKASA
jgi:hypothetical protein